MPKPNVSHPTRHLTSSVIDLADLGTIRLPDQQAIQLLSRTAFALRQSQQTAAGDGQAISRPAEMNLTEESDSLWLRIQLLVRLGLVSDRRLPSWLTRMVTSFKDEQPNVLAELAARLEWICLALSPLPAVCAPRPAFVPFVAQTICERDAHFPMEARGAAAARVDVAGFFKLPKEVIVEGFHSLAGGWTDTPPITYQMGPALPAVLSLSIKVNGKLPIRCRCSRLNQFQGIFYQEMSAGTRKPTLHFASAKQVFANCNRPSQPGSLICAVLVIAGVVREELWAGERRHFFSLTGPGRGILIRTESDLPHGSGLGSSSILSAALLATLARLRGQRPIPDRQLIHAVLQVEQLHTTGGGWQDQMGGCLPGGAKLGWVSPGAGRRCCWRVIPFGGQLRQQFSHRLVLIYTGQTRLAKTLLQQVLLSWARGEPLIRETVERLAEGARQAADALLRGEFPSAICMEYNELKKRFAQNTEPPRVGQLKRELLERGLAEAAWMAGAGGGGFLYLWLANGVDAAQLETLLANQKCWLGMSLWRVDLEELKPLEVE